MNVRPPHHTLRKNHLPYRTNQEICASNTQLHGIRQNIDLSVLNSALRLKDQSFNETMTFKSSLCMPSKIFVTSFQPALHLLVGLSRKWMLTPRLIRLPYPLQRSFKNCCEHFGVSNVIPKPPYELFVRSSLPIFWLLGRHR